MNKRAAAFLFALTVAGAGRLAAADRDVLVRFDGGVGVIPVSNGAGTANPDLTLPNVKLNVVRGVAPGGGPWRIASLKAEVSADGRIHARGRGLLLASGNSFGQTAKVSVFATLICEATGPFVERNTLTSVALAPNGDFRIDDVLSPAPTDCASPVLLIRAASNGAWLAGGIQQLDDEN